MPPSTAQLSDYNARRQARLEGLSQLRHADNGPSRAWYVAGELLVIDDGRRAVEQYLAQHRTGPGPAGDEEVAPGLRRYHATGLDIATAVRAVHGALPSGANVVGPNHVFLSSPFNHGGPYGPPSPVAGSTIPPRPSTPNPVPVTIIDTGLWPDSKLPADYLQPGGVEPESQTDADHNGILDGDVGHANFIGGIIASHASRVELSVLKVLDTFGVCTEAQLITALGRVDASTKIINLSLGGFTPDDLPPMGLRLALEAALSGHDRVVVAAAGNDGNHTNPFWPAAFAAQDTPWSAQVAAVAAHDGKQLCDWSNTGPWITVAAPGQDIESTFVNHVDHFPDGWAMWSGTSFAAPRLVAEIAARIGEQVSAVAALAQVKAEVAASNMRFGDCAVLP